MVDWFGRGGVNSCTPGKQRCKFKDVFDLMQPDRKEGSDEVSSARG